MSKIVDERIVSMQFDNKGFERGVAQSLGSIKNLNASLNSLNVEKTTHNFEALNKVTNNVHFDGLESALESLSQRFSTIGIIGMTTIQNITTALTNKLAGGIRSVINQIKTGGLNRALNLENAQFQIEGLGYNWTKTLEDVNYAVQDTAYGLDSAAKAAGQLAAGGVKLGDNMKTALRGISGVAAMTNSSYDDIARIFEGVAAVDRVYANDILSLSTRGINAYSTLAKYLNKNTKQIKDMVSDGKIDFKTFAAAMDDAFGEHAKEANKTFTGAMSNVKAALSRVGEMFQTPKNEALRQFYVELIPVINNAKKAMSGFADNAENAMMKVSKIGQQALNYIRLLQNGKTLNDAVFGNIDANNRQAIKWSKDTIKTYKTALKDWGVETKDLSGKVSTILGQSGEYKVGKNKSINIAFSPMLQTKEGAKVLDKKTVNTYLNSLIKSAGKDFTQEDLLALDAKGMEINGQKIQGLIAGIGDNAKETAGILQYFGDNGYLKDMSPTLVTILNIIAKIRNFAVEIGEKVSKIGKNLASGLGSYIEPAFKVLSNMFGDGEVLSGLTSFLDKIAELTSKLKLNEAETTFLTAVYENLFGKLGNTWSNILTGFSNIWAAIKDYLYPIKEAFSDVFGDVFTKENLLNTVTSIIEFIENLSYSFVSLSNSMGLTGEGANDLYTRFWNFFAAIRIGIDWIKTFGGRIENWGEILDFIKERFIKFAETLKMGFESWGNTKIAEWFSNFINMLKGAIDPIEIITSLFNGFFDALATVFQLLVPVIVNVGNKLVEGIKNIFSGIKDAFANGDIDKMSGLLETGLFSTVLYVLKDFINTLDGLFVRFGQVFGRFLKDGGKLSGIGTIMSNFFNTLRSAVINYSKGLKVKILLESAAAIGILALSCLVLTSIPEDKLKQVIGAILALFTGLAVLYKLISGSGFFSDFKNAGKNISVGLGEMFSSLGEAAKMNAVGNLFMKIGVGILALSVAMKIIASIPEDALWRSLLAIGALMGGLTIVVKEMSKLKFGELNSIMKNITKFAKSILIMAIAVRIIGSMDQTSIVMGVGAIGALMYFTAKYLEFVGGLEKNKKAWEKSSSGEAAKAFTEMASNMILMAVAVRIIGTMDENQIIMGVGAIGALMLFTAKYLEMMSTMDKTGSKSASKAAQAFTEMASNMILMAIAVRIIGTMKPEQVIMGTLAIGALMEFVVIYAQLMDKVNNSKSSASALVTFSAGILILAIAIRAIASLDPTGVATSVVAIGALLSMFAMMATYSKELTNLQSTAVSLVIFAAAIAILAPALTLLSSIPFPNLISGLFGIAVAFGIFIGAALLMSKIGPAIEGAALQMLIFAGATALIGIGLLAAGLGLQAIAAGIIAVVAALSGSIMTILGLLPGILLIVKQLVVGLLKIVKDSLPLIGDILLQLIDLAIEIFIIKVGDLIAAVCETVDKVLTALDEHVKPWGLKVLNILINVLNIVSSKADKLVTALMNLLLKVIVAIGKWLGKAIAPLVEKFKSFGQNIIDGLKQGIQAKKEALIGKLETVAELIPETVKKLLGIASPSKVMAKIGGFIMDGLTKGIDNGASDTILSMEDAINSIIEAASTEVDASPVITPVLDLSAVKSGSASISSMLGGSSIGLNGNLGAIAIQMNRNQNKTTNADVVSAIGTLRKTIEDNPKTVNNVNGITYSGNSDISDAINILVDAALINERSS